MQFPSVPTLRIVSLFFIRQSTFPSALFSTALFSVADIFHLMLRDGFRRPVHSFCECVIFPPGRSNLVSVRFFFPR